MGAVPKRKISTHRKGKRRKDVQRKFNAKVVSRLSKEQRLNQKNQSPAT